MGMIYVHNTQYISGFNMQFSSHIKMLTREIRKLNERPDDLSSNVAALINKT